MALEGRVEFTDGSRIGSSDLNSMARQMVANFASTSDRNAAWPSGDRAEDGTLAFVRSNNTNYRWDESSDSWISLSSGGGGGGGVTYGDTLTWTWQPNTSQVTLAHGLGQIPDGVFADLVCITADRGWPVGTVLPMLHLPWRVTIALTDTDVIIQPSNSTNRFGLAFMGTPRSASDFIANRWQYRIRPYTVS